MWYIFDFYKKYHFDKTADNIIIDNKGIYKKQNTQNIICNNYIYYI